jgi:hypothetical protein
MYPNLVDPYHPINFYPPFPYLFNSKQEFQEYLSQFENHDLIKNICPPTKLETKDEDEDDEENYLKSTPQKQKNKKKVGLFSFRKLKRFKVMIMKSKLKKLKEI